MRPLRSFILVSVSLVIVFMPKRAAKACGFFVGPGEYRFWLLQPDLTGQYNLTPFYFATSHLYKGDMWLAKETYPHQNVEEWYKEIKGKARKADIDSLLYATDPQYYFDEPKRIAKENEFMRYLLQPANKELHRYMTLSKKVEQLVAQEDPWEEYITPQADVDKVIAVGRALYNDAKTPFVRLRTAFQLVRLYGLNHQPDMLSRVYDTWVEPTQTNSWIKSAALYQKAIHLAGFEKHYLLSRVFDRGDYNRTPCLVYFDSEHLDSILPFAKNQHEWNVLHAMRAFNYPGRSLQYLKNIYATEPDYKDLPFLLLREINKAEDWLLTNKVTSFESPAVYDGDYWFTYSGRDEYIVNAVANYRNDIGYTEQLYQFIKQVISDNKSRSTSLIHLYAAHLCLLLKEYASCSYHLEQAAASKNNDAKLKTQISINRFLLHLENGFDARGENEFMSLMKTPDAATGLYDPGIMKNQLVLYTARKLVQQGNKAKGLMLFSRTNRAFGELPISAYKGVYQEIEEAAEPRDYDQMLHILDKNNKTPFEKFVTTGHFSSPYELQSWYEAGENEKVYWDRNKLLDCKASWYLRHRKLEASMSVMKQIPDSFYAKEPYSYYIGGNPFYVNAYNAHPVTKEDKRDLDKKEVVSEMIYLQQLARKDIEKAGECYFQLGNAWYNMSYWGKNWLMVKQWWSDSEIGYYSNERQTTFTDDYYGCAYARSYYVKAIQSTKDPKLTALCHYMIRQCDENNTTYLETLYGDKYIPVKSYNKPKGKEVTSYYEGLIKECELYQSFTRQYNRNLRF